MRCLLLILTSAFLFILGFSTLAQVKGGIKGGVNYSFYQFKGVPEYEERATPMVGFFAGVFVTVPITEIVFVRPECLVSVRGWNDKVSYDYATGLIYLDFPLLAGYHVSPKFKLLAGPQFGYIVGGFVSEQQNRFEAALAGGLSYYLFKRLEVEARYNHGFTSLKEGDYFSCVGSDLDGPYKGGKNRTVQVSLAYQLKVK